MEKNKDKGLALRRLRVVLMQMTVLAILIAPSALAQDIAAPVNGIIGASGAAANGDHRVSSPFAQLFSRVSQNQRVAGNFLDLVLSTQDGMLMDDVVPSVRRGIDFMQIDLNLNGLGAIKDLYVVMRVPGGRLFSLVDPLTVIEVVSPNNPASYYPIASAIFLGSSINIPVMSATTVPEDALLYGYYVAAVATDPGQSVLEAATEQAKLANPDYLDVESFRVNVRASQ